MTQFSPTFATDKPLSSLAKYRLDGGSIALIFLAAFMLRALQFGNPVVQIDEQFYLFAGDRLLSGAFPYVDIWDRKPFGLFAIYAAIRLLGGVGIVQYQIVATIFAATTALVIARIGLRIATQSGAVFAGIVYLCFILSSGGDGGQAPVFYNLFVAVAALLVLKIQERGSFDRMSLTMACSVMVFIGLALQIKYTVVFEGVFLGCWLLWLNWRMMQQFHRVALLASVLVIIALLPTFFVYLVYYRIGAQDQFIFQNFISIFQRSSQSLDITSRLITIVIHVALPLVVAVWGIMTRVDDRAAQRFIGAWSAAAIGGLLLFGTYHSHYAVPLFSPLAAAGAPIYGTRRIYLGLQRFRPKVAVAVILVGTLLGIGTMIGTRMSRGTGSAVFAAANLVGQNPPGCIFVFSGDPILYHLTRSCLPTSYNFPTLLSERADSGSLGRSQMVLLREVMAKSPAYVFERVPMLEESQPQAWKFMADVLAREYRPVFRQRAGNSEIVGFKHI